MQFLERTMSSAEKVDPMAVRTTAADLVSDQPSAEGGTFHYHQIAELHRYVNENITYVPDPSSNNYVAPPNETLKTEAGDCDCQAVLVASLFEAIGATTRLARCESTSGDWHVLPEVYLADSENVALNDVCDSLGDYYSSYGIDYTGFSWDYDSGKYWFLADIAMGEYVGDKHYLPIMAIFMNLVTGGNGTTLNIFIHRTQPHTSQHPLSCLSHRLGEGDCLTSTTLLI